MLDCSYPLLIIAYNVEFVLGLITLVLVIAAVAMIQLLCACVNVLTKYLFFMSVEIVESK